MWTENNKKYFEAILNCPSLEPKKVDRYKYLLKYAELRWYIWPRSGRYRHISPDGVHSEMFFGEMKQFYHRYLTKGLRLPCNFGKTWNCNDENMMYDMITYAYTLNQGARALKRHPVSVLFRLARYLDDSSLHNRINENMYDVPIRSLLDRDS